MVTVRTVTELLDLTGIGNAIVDVIAQADDSFLTSEGLTKMASDQGDRVKGDWPDRFVNPATGTIDWFHGGAIRPRVAPTRRPVRFRSVLTSSSW